ncbi:hypothetical protein ACLOJK_021247 [Asimina triloba]
MPYSGKSKITVNSLIVHASSPPSFILPSSNFFQKPPAVNNIAIDWKEDEVLLVTVVVFYPPISISTFDISDIRQSLIYYIEISSDLFNSTTDCLISSDHANTNADVDLDHDHLLIRLCRSAKGEKISNFFPSSD